MIAKDQTKIRAARAVLLAASVASSLGACSAVVPSPQSYAVRNPDGTIYDPATSSPIYAPPRPLALPGALIPQPHLGNGGDDTDVVPPPSPQRLPPVAVRPPEPPAPPDNNNDVPDTGSSN
jgi:hypothetical protein